jgi:hypothetical protein
VAGNFNIDTAVVTETPDAALPKDTGGDHDTVVRLSGLDVSGHVIPPV